MSGVRRGAGEAPRPPAVLQLYVQPRAAKTAVAGMHGDRIKIRLAAAPVDNAANIALIEFIAARLGIAKRRVRLVAGASSRSKTLEIDGLGTAAVALALRVP